MNRASRGQRTRLALFFGREATAPSGAVALKFWDNSYSNRTPFSAKLSLTLTDRLGMFDDAIGSVLIPNYNSKTFQLLRYSARSFG